MLIRKNLKNLKQYYNFYPFKIVCFSNKKNTVEQNISRQSNFFDKDGNFVGLDAWFDSLPRDNIYEELKKVLYGKKIDDLTINENAKNLASKFDFQILACKIPCEKEENSKQRIIRIGAIQNKIVLPTTEPFELQKMAIINKVTKIIEAAYYCGVNVICLQECWNSPFFLWNKDKHRWLEYAESAFDGITTKHLKDLARKYNMVIISPILQKDENSNILWNSAVVIDNYGDIIGLTHKNHIPTVGDFDESSIYKEGECGNPVFQTDFGLIAVNIGYGRHYPLHWLALGLNGAEIVFNPSATPSGSSESIWGIEPRNAAIANSFFAVPINRVGTEVFNDQCPKGKTLQTIKSFYGSSYIAGPDGTRTFGLSKFNDGLLVAEVDLNQCERNKQRRGFLKNPRYDLYSTLLTKYLTPNFQKQITKK